MSKGKAIKVKLPPGQFISIAPGKALKKNKYEKCQNGDQILASHRYVCIVDTIERKMTPIRKAEESEYQSFKQNQ